MINNLIDNSIYWLQIKWPHENTESSDFKKLLFLNCIEVDNKIIYSNILEIDDGNELMHSGSGGVFIDQVYKAFDRNIRIKNCFKE